MAGARRKSRAYQFMQGRVPCREKQGPAGNDRAFEKKEIQTMEAVMINQALKMCFPDGFRKLSEEEKKAMHFLEDGSGECVACEEKHIMVSIGWKPAGFLPGLLLKSADLARAAEGRVARAMKGSGYQLTGFEDRSVGGETGRAFRYTYQAQGTDMSAETVSLKIGKTLYYFNFYVRSGVAEEGMRIWNEVLAGAQWQA